MRCVTPPPRSVRLILACITPPPPLSLYPPPPPFTGDLVTTRQRTVQLESSLKAKEREVERLQREVAQVRGR